MLRYSSYSLEELVDICKDTRDVSAWDEFVLRTHRYIHSTVWSTIRRWGILDRVVVEDLVQETYLKLTTNGAALLRDFSARHPQAILGYLRATAVSVTHDHCKGMTALKRGSSHTAGLDERDPPADPSRYGGIASTERDILLGQIDDILRTPDELTARRDRQIFWLYYRHGLTAKSIAAIPQLGLSAKGVESVLQRVTRFVRTELIHCRRSGKPSDLGVVWPL